MGLEDFAQEAIARHSRAFDGKDSGKLEDTGYYRFRRDGEYHGNNPAVVKALAGK